GFYVTIIDPTKKILANGSYLESVVDINTSIKNISNMTIANTNVILMPGFIAGNKYYELVLLGRNSSDYSAIILAICLRAKKCEIWKDVDGIYDQDPKFTSKAKLFKHIYYNDLLDLIKLGSKILHFNSVSLAKKFNISCIIKNINNPNLSGTILHNS
ncbi:MAG: bifunctional aspartate kinase/homoserine dehydrogenase I, partial [Candidatus Lightella neohaematopini]|nr:bifunctional aspartate kinase/homoserine dehydrogenase I [Candidatus Lightella neohaematopini]